MKNCHQLALWWEDAVTTVSLLFRQQHSLLLFCLSLFFLCPSLLRPPLEAASWLRSPRMAIVAPRSLEKYTQPPLPKKKMNNSDECMVIYAISYPLVSPCSSPFVHTCVTPPATPTARIRSHSKSWEKKKKSLGSTGWRGNASASAVSPAQRYKTDCEKWKPFVFGATYSVGKQSWCRYYIHLCNCSIG